jgi:hypothetical protein
MLHPRIWEMSNDTGIEEYDYHRHITCTYNMSLAWPKFWRGLSPPYTSYIHDRQFAEKVEIKVFA